MSFSSPSYAILYIIRMSIVCTRVSLVCHSYVTRMYSYVICMPLPCARIIICMYLNAIRMSLVCISSVCHTYVVVCHPYVFGCHPYVTSMWFYREPGRYKVKDLNDVNIVSYIARKVLYYFIYWNYFLSFI